MKTQFETPKEYAEIFIKIAEETDATNQVRPLHFMKVMKENRGFINTLSPFGETKDGLERRNPVIVALGDSVTAGHFEFNGDMKEFFARCETKGIQEDEIIEATDVRESYLEIFRNMLIEKYEQTAVNAINSGIAGDTMFGMQKRVFRDVICYQPDLVLVNGSLNWSQECGDNRGYEKVLKETVQTVKENTKADIVLMTPNMELPGLFPNPLSALHERVCIIRELAALENLCLADTYKVWEIYHEQGHPLQFLLANGKNHPSTVGHEVYAKVLMKLVNEDKK